MGLFIVIFTNTPRNYQNLIFAGIPFIFTLQRYMYTVPVLKQKKKTCFHEQFLAPFLKRHHYNSYGSQELVAAHTHAELKVCPPLPPPIKNNVPQPPVSFSYWGLPGPLLTSTKSVFCFTLIFWFYYDHYSTFWSNCRTSPSRLSTESGNTPIAMVSAVNFRTTFSSFGFISSDIDIEDNRYSLHYYLCVMQDVKCVIHLWEFSCPREKRSKK